MKKSVRNSERCIPGTTNQLLQSEIGREFDGYQTSAGRVLELKYIVTPLILDI